MTENSFNNWASMSDHVLAKHIGTFIKNQRIEQNKTQTTLAAEAGISRSTLSLLERGESVNLATLIQVLRVLDQLQIMQAFDTQKGISPLALAKLEKRARKRARGRKEEKTNETDW